MLQALFRGHNYNGISDISLQNFVWNSCNVRDQNILDELWMILSMEAKSELDSKDVKEKKNDAVARPVPDAVKDAKENRLPVSEDFTGKSGKEGDKGGEEVIGKKKGKRKKQGKGQSSTVSAGGVTEDVMEDGCDLTEKEGQAGVQVEKTKKRKKKEKHTQSPAGGEKLENGCERNDEGTNGTKSSKKRRKKESSGAVQLQEDCDSMMKERLADGQNGESVETAGVSVEKSKKQKRKKRTAEELEGFTEGKKKPKLAREG